MTFIRFFFAAARRWHRQGAEQRAAALAYFTPFALTPLIILSITILGVILGPEHVTNLLVRWGSAIDPGATALLYDSVLNFESVGTHYFMPILGIVFLAGMVFIALNSLIAGLHAMWGVRPVTWRHFFLQLWHSAIFILVLEGYLTALIVVNDIFSFLSATTELSWVGLIPKAFGLFATVLLLSIAYGLLPLTAPSRTARLSGASVAGVLLLFSNELVALYFATAPVQSLFGAAGLLISLLVWVYVAAAIVLYGAACAYVYDSMHEVGDRTATT